MVFCENGPARSQAAKPPTVRLMPSAAATTLLRLEDRRDVQKGHGELSSTMRRGVPQRTHGVKT